MLLQIKNTSVHDYIQTLPSYYRVWKPIFYSLLLYWIQSCCAVVAIVFSTPSLLERISLFCTTCHSRANTKSIHIISLSTTNIWNLSHFPHFWFVHVFQTRHFALLPFLFFPSIPESFKFHFTSAIPFYVDSFHPVLMVEWASKHAGAIRHWAVSLLAWCKGQGLAVSKVHCSLLDGPSLRCEFCGSRIKIMPPAI